MNSSKLLTIGLPTYNRGFLLDHFFSNLASVARKHREKIEIIISDNASTDQTEEVCRRHVADMEEEFDIRYTRNSINLGVAKNIVGLFYLGTGQFFLFIGDDDQLDQCGFDDVVAMLEASNKPSAIIQSEWPWIKKPGGPVSFKESLQMFYEYGNVWAAVVDRAAAIRGIETRKLRNVIEQTVWPQTVMGYLAIYDLEKESRQAHFLSKPMGRRSSQIRYSYDNTAYLRRALMDLISVANLVDEHAGRGAVQRAILSPKSRGGVVGLLFGLAQASLVEGVVTEGRAELLAAFSASKELRTRLAAVLVHFVSRPRLVTIAFYTYGIALKRWSPTHVAKKIARLRQTMTLHAGTKGVRQGDWF